jgi:hypothetical protein
MKKPNLKQIFSNADIQLLVFLIFFLNVKFVVKVLAIVFMVAYSRNLRFGLSLKNSRLPLFYLFIILLEIIKYLFVVRNYELNYALVFSMGILQWVLCLLAIHYVKLHVDREEVARTHDTIRAFFMLNFLVSLLFLAMLIIHPVWLTYWGHGADISFNNPSAGDTILGISFDTSTVNATINCLGLIYFLYKRDYLFAIVNILTIVLCTSNATFFLSLAVLILMVLTLRDKKLRIHTLIYSLVFLLLYFLISPKNRIYIRNYFIQLYVMNKNPRQQPVLDTQIYQIRIGDSIITMEKVVEILPDSAYNFSNQKLGKAVGNLISFRSLRRNNSGYAMIPEIMYNSRPGKLISYIQTCFYLSSNVRRFLFGSGIGNFSSKLAFRASGVNALGSYPQKFRYASPEFRYNHLKTYLYYFNADASKHSVLNYPFSVYNQIPGEYGLIGTLLLIIFYLGFFVARYRRLSYGRYMLIILLAFFLLEYWFESLSLIVMFELFMLLNIKEGRTTGEATAPAHGRPQV